MKAPGHSEELKAGPSTATYDRGTSGKVPVGGEESGSRRKAYASFIEPDYMQFQDFPWKAAFSTPGPVTATRCRL